MRLTQELRKPVSFNANSGLSGLSSVTETRRREFNLLPLTVATEVQNSGAILVISWCMCHLLSTDDTLTYR